MKLEDDYAVVFDVGGIDVRVSTVPDFTPNEHTVLGFSVSDVTAAVKALREAWFNDADGNVLSVTNT